MQKLSSKEIIAIWFAVVSAAISITALWMPPQGIIDQSVLILIGQFLPLHRHPDRSGRGTHQTLQNEAESTPDGRLRTIRRIKGHETPYQGPRNAVSFLKVK